MLFYINSNKIKDNMHSDKEFNLNKNIIDYEKNFKLKCNIELPINFFKQYNNYKITAILLLEDANFFYNYHDIIKNNNDYEILINEHYQMIDSYISFTDIFYNIIKNGYLSEFISFMQYKLCKMILKKINNIWFSEYYLKKIYKISKLPSKNELLFFFNIIEILHYKILLNKKLNLDLEDNCDIEIENNRKILNDNYYLSIINNEKIFYENKFNVLNKI
jgi:hypothetical protein